MLHTCRLPRLHGIRPEDYASVSHCHARPAPAVRTLLPSFSHLHSAPAGGHVHEEVFALKHLSGDRKGREWEDIILPIIEKFAKYTEHYCATS